MEEEAEKLKQLTEGVDGEEEMDQGEAPGRQGRERSRSAQARRRLSFQRSVAL